MVKRKTSTTRKYRRKATSGAKKFTNKAKPLVLPVVAGGTFYLQYQKRAEELFKAGEIQNKTVSDAIQYDIKNFNGQDALGRVKDNIIPIAVTGGLGITVKEAKLFGSTADSVMSNVLLGLSAGMLGKVILDPPIENKQISAPARNIRAVTGRPNPAGALPPKLNKALKNNVTSSNCPSCSKWEV